MQFKTFAGALVLAITTTGFAASSIAAPVKEPAPAHKQVKAIKNTPAKHKKVAPAETKRKAKPSAERNPVASKRAKVPAAN